MLLCSLAHTSLASSLINLSPLSTLQLTIFSSPYLLFPFRFFLAELLVWDPCCWRDGDKNKVPCPSPLPFVRRLHSICFLCTHPHKLAPGHCHPNQMKGAHEFVQIDLLISFSTPNQSLTWLVLLLTYPQAAPPPILSNCCFERDAISSNLPWTLSRCRGERGEEGHCWQGCRTKGRASRHHDVWLWPRVEWWWWVS